MHFFVKASNDGYYSTGHIADVSLSQCLHFTSMSLVKVQSGGVLAWCTNAIKLIKRKMARNYPKSSPGKRTSFHCTPSLIVNARMRVNAGFLEHP